MENLNRDVLFSIASKMDLDSLLNFCDSSKRINYKIYKNIWLHKLKEDFPKESLPNISKSTKTKERYVLFYFLKDMKEKLNREEALKNYFYKGYLDLYTKGLDKIHICIGYLSNLQILNLANNHLLEIPSSLSKLSNLEKLYLNNNELTEIPYSLGNLSNLKTLFLNNNKLMKIPPSLGNLTNLQHLYLENNKLEEIPDSLKNLSNLELLNLNDNPLIKFPDSLKNISNLLVHDSLNDLYKLENLYLANNKLVKHILSSSENINF